MDPVGNNGQCAGIPAEAIGVAINVTFANPTADSYLAVFPAGAATPDTSNLNWSAGQAPAANSVNAKLSADGKLGLFNRSAPST